MEQMKSWVLSKCKDAPKLLPLDKESQNQNLIHRVVVTPKNIPEFTIPKTNAYPEGRSPESGGTLSPDGGDPEFGSQSSGGSQPCSLPASNHSSPRHSPTVRQQVSPVFLQPPGRTTRSKSAPVSPINLESPSDESQFDPYNAVRSCDFLHFLGNGRDDTNADPMSLAAMSLPHFKVKTAFGFDTLTQNPHTRRRESLFHMGARGSPPLSRSPSSKSNKGGRDGSLSPKPAPVISIDVDNDAFSRKPSCKRRNVPSVITPLGIPPPQQHTGESPLSSPRTVSPNSSPQSTPEILRKTQEAMAGGNGKRRSSRRQKLYYRRRSSLPGLPDAQTVCPFCHQQYADEATGNGPSTSATSRVRRRSSDNVAESISPCDKDKLRRARSVRISATKDSSFTRSTSLYSHVNQGSGGSQRACSCNYTRNKLEARLLADLGEVKLTMRYLPEKSMLKVVVLRAENLGGQQRSGHSVNCFIKLCLMPGKQQKQGTSIIKHTRDPVFNQEFVFTGITQDDLSTASVKLRFFHKPNNLRREELLGEVVVALATLNLDKETRFWKNLEREMLTEELGCLQVKACFEPSIEKLCVTVLQASALPKHPLTGAPDPYVKLELIQPGRSGIKRQTKTKKKTVNPKFEESFVFDISPKIGDLNYTGLTLTVFDHERIRSDEVLAQVRLGYGATEKAEFQHWNLVLQHPGQEFVQWHTLMEDD